MKYHWKAHPLIENPLRTVALMAVLIVMGVFIYYIFESGFYVILYALFFFASFLAYWFPTSFDADDEGIRIQRLWFKFFKPWDSFRRITSEKGGFFLSPFSGNHWLEKTRGMFIMCRTPQKEAIIEFITGRIKGES